MFSFLRKKRQLSTLKNYTPVLMGMSYLFKRAFHWSDETHVSKKNHIFVIQFLNVTAFYETPTRPITNYTCMLFYSIYWKYLLKIIDGYFKGQWTWCTGGTAMSHILCDLSFVNLLWVTSKRTVWGIQALVCEISISKIKQTFHWCI